MGGVVQEVKRKSRGKDSAGNDVDLSKKASGEQSTSNFDGGGGTQELRRKSRGKDSAAGDVGWN